MAKIDSIVSAMRQNPGGIKFGDLVKICTHYFGKPRQEGTSHKVYKMPWQGDPRVNIQEQKGYGKSYQVKQVLKAIDKLEEER